MPEEIVDGNPHPEEEPAVEETPVEEVPEAPAPEETPAEEPVPEVAGEQPENPDDSNGYGRGY